MTQPTEYEQVTYNSPGGAQMGKSASELNAFYGKTPVVQPSGASQTAISATQTTKTTTQLRAELTNVKTFVRKLRLDLVALGLIKGAA